MEIVTIQDLGFALGLILEEYNFIRNPRKICEIAQEELDVTILPCHVAYFFKKRREEEEENFEREEFSRQFFGFNMKQIY